MQKPTQRIVKGPGIDKVQAKASRAYSSRIRPYVAFTSIEPSADQTIMSIHLLLQRMILGRVEHVLYKLSQQLNPRSSGRDAVHLPLASYQNSPRFTTREPKNRYRDRDVTKLRQISSLWYRRLVMPRKNGFIRFTATQSLRDATSPPIGSNPYPWLEEVGHMGRMSVNKFVYCKS